VKLLNPDAAQRERAIVEARAAKHAAANAERVAYQRAAFAKGQAETAELNDLRSKDLAFCVRAHEEVLGDIARFALLPDDSDEGRELNEALENLVVAYAGSVRLADARAGQVAALDARADAISTHLAREHRRGSVGGGRHSQRDVWRRQQEKLRGIVAKAAEGHNISGERGIFLLDLLRAGLNDAWHADRRIATIAAAEKAAPAARAKLAVDRERNPVVLGRGYVPDGSDK
jgi:hypothetical protein